MVGLICIPTNSVGGFLPPYILTNMCYFVFLVITILTWEGWNLNVVLTCISLMAEDSDCFRKII
jgi:hypothetical protein